MDDQDRCAEKGEQYASQDHFLQTHTPIPELDEEKDGNITRTGTSSSTATGSNTTPDTSDAKPRPPPEQLSDTDNLQRHTSTLSRIHTQRSQHSHTVGSIFRSRSSRSRPLPAFGAGKPYPPPLGSQEDYVVEFDGPDDPLHAQNWAVRKKIFTAAMLGFTTMTAAFASSIFSTATRQISEKFAVGSVVATLGTSFSFMGFAAFTLNLLFLSESYPPMILVAKAEELRRRTKNWGIHAKQEEIEIDFRELLEKNFSRPLRMLVTERIVLLLSVYMAFIYGLLYLFLTAYPLVFQGVHRMNPGVGGLPFFGAIIGELLAGTLVFVRQPGYQKKLAANNNVPIPEWRLPEVIAGGVCFAGGIFWFGWTGYKADIHWIVPTLSGLLIGFGIMSIFLQAFNYLIDAYLMFAASAIAANTFLRSLCAAAFPLFARQMFEGMGIEWAATLLGCIAAAMVPVPVWFYLQGAKIREKSAYAPTNKPAPIPSDNEMGEA
ncbi:unnamed protein product [Alternaria alternata]